MTVDLGATTATGASQVTGIFDVTGGSAGDSLTGDGAANVLRGGPGADTLLGGAGDTLEGGLGSDTILAPAADNTWNITSTDTGTVGGVTFSTIENLSGGSGVDLFVLADGAGVSGAIDGGTGVDSLDYSAYLTAVTVDLGATTATGASQVTGIFDVTGGSAGDSLTGDGAANVLRGGPGADTLLGGAGDTLEGGLGSDTILAPAADNTWNITSTDTGTVGGVAFSTIENLSGGSGVDLFVFQEDDSWITGTIDGGEGFDTSDFSPRQAAVVAYVLDAGSMATSGFKRFELLIGSTGDDTLIGPAIDRIWNITGANAGNVGTLAFTGIENLTGGLGRDDFVFGDGAGVSGVLDGGVGINTLDYSAYITGVSLNRATGAATGTGGASNIQSVIGGLGADTLIGSDADSTWNITGANAGNVGTLAFTIIENLTGGASACSDLASASTLNLSTSRAA